MIESLIKLIKKLKNRYKIKKENILGHSDIAPYRKKDPGENFPWIKLFNSKLIYYPDKDYDLHNFNLEKWFKNKKILTRKGKILFMLSYIGYDINLSLNKNDYHYRKLIKVYCHHFYNNSKNRKKFSTKYELIKVHFINQLLTF